MGRPKGSKNKVKDKKMAEIKKPEIKKESPPKIVPPVVPEKTICTCEHDKKMHYGGEHGWCNTEGCYCQTFR